MTKTQKITIFGFIVILLGLQFGFSTKPKKLIAEEKTRALNLKITDIGILRSEAMLLLSGDQRSTIQILQSKLDQEIDSSGRVSILKELSGTWYKNQNYCLAGHYAEQIALLNQSSEAWGIAGTTYAVGVKSSTEEKQRIFCKEKALQSLENAMSLDPNNIDYEINRGVVYADRPDADNPMKGIQILLKLNKNFPKNVPVMNNLAKFALQTNQLDKAEQRLTTALELEPNNRLSNCLMVQVYGRTGRTDGIERFRDLCENTNKN